MMDLKEAKKNAVAMMKGLEIWSDAAKVIETIESNKQFLEVAKATKAEYNANVEDLAIVNKKCAGVRREIAGEDVKLADIKRRVVDGVAGMKSRLEMELAEEMEDKRIELNQQLDSERDELSLVTAQVMTAKAELSDTKADLGNIQASIRGMLG